MGQRTLEMLERTLKHRFRDRALLERAVTHSSLAFEKGIQGAHDNEKLEFLGDAVLGLLVAQSLYESFPDLEEGDLTRLRAALVSRRHLGHVAESIHLGDHLRLGRGEERNGGRRKTVLLANSFEAVLAALYLDAGVDGARDFVQRTVIDPTAQRLYQGLGRGDTMGDHKSALQEMLQAKGAAPPEYEVKAESGPDHRKRFLVEVIIPASPAVPPVTAQGTGTTKKRAEQEAARVAFQQLHEQETVPAIIEPDAPALDEQETAPVVTSSAASTGRKAPPLHEQSASPLDDSPRQDSPLQDSPLQEQPASSSSSKGVTA